MLGGFVASTLSVTALYSVLGIALGLGINKLNQVLDDRLLRRAYSSPWAAVPLKLLPMALVLTSVAWAFPSFEADWQGTTPGLFFVGLFFGMQTSLMEDLGRLFN